MEAGKFAIGLGAAESSINIDPDLATNSIGYLLRATLNRQLAVIAQQRQHWRDYDSTTVAAVTDYKLLHEHQTVRSELETLHYCGAIFMAFQFKSFDVLSINFETIIKLCETIRDESLKPPAELLIARTLLALRQIKNGRNILTSILSHSGDAVQGQAFRFLVENIIDSISDEEVQDKRDTDELYDEIEELENISSILQEPSLQIQLEFRAIQRRNSAKLKLYIYTALQQKQMKFLKFLTGLSN